LGNESSPSTSPKVTSPSKNERKNLFGGSKQDDVSGGASSKKKRSRIVDKSEESRNIVLIQTKTQELDKDDDNRDIELVLEEFDKQETMKNS